MKRIILLLVGIILPSLVLADASAPSISEYKALIKNSNGVKCENFTIPYNTEVTVVMEYDKNDIAYVDVRYNNDYCTIKMSDIALKDKFNLDDFSNEFYLYKYVYKKGAYLYKGPSKIYGKVDDNIELPVGLKLKIEYFDEQWGYVTYNGVSGWVFIYEPTEFNLYEENTALADIDNGTIYTLEEITLDSGPYNGEKTDIVIPKGEKVKYNLSYCAKFNEMCSIYLTYNGKRGWYGYNKNDYRKIALVPEKGSLYILNDTDIYEDSNFNKKIGKLEKNQEVEVIYYQYDYEKLYENSEYVKYYIKNNEIKGWVTLIYGQNGNNLLESTNMIDGKYQQFLVINPIKVYDNFDGKKEIGTIPKDKKIDLVYEKDTASGNYFYAREYNGWIKYNANDMELIEKFVEIDIEPNDVEEAPKVNGKEIALYCLGGAIIIALVSIVTIKLINKKKEEIVQ